MPIQKTIRTRLNNKLIKSTVKHDEKKNGQYFHLEWKAWRLVSHRMRLVSVPTSFLKKARLAFVVIEINTGRFCYRMRRLYSTAAATMMKVKQGHKQSRPEVVNLPWEQQCRWVTRTEKKGRFMIREDGWNRPLWRKASILVSGRLRFAFFVESAASIDWFFGNS